MMIYLSARSPNNNPFEYWVTLQDTANDAYVQLMKGVESLVSDPGERDVTVDRIFTPTMFLELRKELEASGLERDLETLDEMWSDLRNRKAISGE